MNDLALPFRLRSTFSAPPLPTLSVPEIPFHPSLFRWKWFGCSGLFVFGKEIPCLCGGGCPGVFIFFFFPFLLFLFTLICSSHSPLQCTRERTHARTPSPSEHRRQERVNMALSSSVHKHVVFMCLCWCVSSDVSSGSKWFWCRRESAGVYIMQRWLTL